MLNRSHPGLLVIYQPPQGQCFRSFQALVAQLELRYLRADKFLIVHQVQPLFQYLCLLPQYQSELQQYICAAYLVIFFLRLPLN